MTPVQSTSKELPQNSWLSSQKILLLAGATATLYFLYRFFTRNDLSTQQVRALATLFPRVSVNATHPLYFTPAAGMFKIKTDYILPPVLRNSVDQVFIECSYRNQPFYTQVMTPGPSFVAYLPEIPFKSKMTLRVLHRDFVKMEVELQADHAMGGYEIFPNGPDWKTRHHPYTTPQPVGEPYYRNRRDLEAPMLIVIGQDRPIRFTNLAPDNKVEPNCTIDNRSHDIHILFFQILGTHPDLPSGEVYVLPIVASSRTITELPSNFFKKNWELAYRNVKMTNPPAETILQLLFVRDTLSKPYQWSLL